MWDGYNPIFKYMFIYLQFQKDTQESTNISYFYIYIWAYVYGDMWVDGGRSMKETSMNILRYSYQCIYLLPVQKIKNKEDI